MPRKATLGPIRVGYQTLEVTETDEHALPEALGDYQADVPRIRVRGGLSPQQLGNVLLHEALHAVWATQGLSADLLAKDPEALEEAVVNALANGLAQVFRDNPAFIDRVQRELRP